MWAHNVGLTVGLYVCALSSLVLLASNKYRHIVIMVVVRQTIFNRLMVFHMKFERELRRVDPSCAGMDDDSQSGKTPSDASWKSVINTRPTGSHSCWYFNKGIFFLFLLFCLAQVD